jgi:hypothetical protein
LPFAGRRRAVDFEAALRLAVERFAEVLRLAVERFAVDAEREVERFARDDPEVDFPVDLELEPLACGMSFSF